jgi:hypothetical protein
LKKCCGVGGPSGGPSGGPRGNQPSSSPLDVFERASTSTHSVSLSDMSTADIMEWASPPARLKETQDQGAQDFLEAHVLFKQGIQCAQSGDLEQGEVLIASAFLLDNRAVQTWPSPEPMPAGVPMLEYKLLFDMINAPQDPRKGVSYSHELFHVILGLNKISHMLGGREELNYIQNALGVLDAFLRQLKAEPYLEGDGENGVLGGLFRSARFHILKAHLSQRLGNDKQAVRSFTGALASNPKGTEHDARLFRAIMWGVQKAKTDKELHDEFKKWISVSHPESRHMYGACAWLAVLTFRDYQCGTYEDGVEWLRKAKAAKARSAYLYGAEENDAENAPPVWTRALKSYPVRDGGLGGLELEDMVRVRREVDRFEAERSPALEERLERVTIGGDVDGVKPRCLKCGADTPKDGGPRLLMCACKVVYYCSKDCQTEHWPNHKGQCKTAREAKQRQKQAEAERDPTRVPQRERGGDVDEATYGVCFRCPPGEDDEETKASVELNRRCSTGECPCRGAHSEIQRSQRMEARLKEDLDKHGSRLSTWWHDMSMSEREETLRIVTDNLPSKPLTPDDVKRKTANGTSAEHAEGLSLLLREYSVEYLSGKCECSKLPEDEKLGHPHDDMLIHELWARGVDVESTEDLDYEEALTLKHYAKAVPGFYDGSVAAYENPGNCESIYDVLVGEKPAMVVTDRAGAGEMAQIDRMIGGRFLFEASALRYALARRSISLMLLTKLVQRFHERERREPVRHEFGRLNGCDTCEGVCEGDRASCCKDCMLTWWCSATCRRSSPHHRRCPYIEHGGRTAVMAVGFPA